MYIKDAVGISRLTRPVLFLAAMALVLAGPTGGAAQVAQVATGSTQAAVDPTQCPAGFSQQLNTCARIGGPEQPYDKAAMARQEAAPYLAGSGLPTDGAFMAAIAARNAMAVDTANGSAWKQVGKAPLYANGNYSQVATTGQYIKSLGWTTLTGRITDYALDSHTGRLWAGETEGGVWQSNDRGKSWRSIGDNLVTQAVGALAWTNANGGTLIVGTGDNGQGRYSYAGHGFWYTHDEGRTWLASRGLPDNASTFRIAVDPDHQNIIYGATSRGLFRSVDGGVSFQNEMLPTSPPGYPVNCAGDITHTPICFLANVVTDVVVRRSGGAGGTVAPGAVLATVGYRFGSNAYRSPDGTTSTGTKLTPQAGMYRSTTGAPGSFTYVAGGSNGYPVGTSTGRVAMAGAIGPAQNHDIVYALVQDPNKENYCTDTTDIPTSICRAPTSAVILPLPGANVSTVLDGGYVSHDFGLTWTKIIDWAQLDLPGTNSAIGGPGGQAPVGYGPGIQASYNLWILPDPIGADSAGNPPRLLFGLEEIWQSNPLYTGLNQKTTDWRLQTAEPTPWSVIGRYWNSCGPFTFGTGFQCNALASPIAGGTTHPDQHAAIIVPDPSSDGETLVAGNDGGVFTQHVGTGGQYSNDAWGIGNSGQIQGLQCYDAEISKDGTVVCGMQDNGEMKVDPKTGLQSMIYGGDGFWSIIDPNNSNNIIEEYVGGRTAATHDGGVTWGIGNPNLTNARFSTPLQMDPYAANHYMIGGREVKESVSGYGAPSWTTVYDLGTSKQPGVAAATPSPGDSDNSTTAVDLSGDDAYVGFCANCDVVLEGNPFTNGLATNVGSGTAKQLTGNGWHMAKLLCPSCAGTNGRLPQRYITSVRIDPKNRNTIYVTEGGYQRQWIPPGTFGEANPYIGSGHVFKSTDHGDHFTDITGNLPDVVAWFSVLHDGHLIVSTDIGVFQSSDTNGGAYSVLGTGLPAAPVKTIRLQPGHPDVLLAATWGRGAYTLCLAPTCPLSGVVTPVVPHVPNTAAGVAALLLPWTPVVLVLAAAVAVMLPRRRRAAVQG